MKASSVVSMVCGVLSVAVTGCSSPSGAHRGAAAGSPASTQQEVADQARDSRTQAYALAEMADRRQLEADVMAKELGPDHPSVEKKRRLAEELRAAAQEADQAARTLRRDVPHGMVQ
jgi:hypothetical protein